MIFMKLKTHSPLFAWQRVFSLLSFLGIALLIVAATSCLFAGGVPPLASVLMCLGLVTALWASLTRACGLLIFHHLLLVQTLGLLSVVAQLVAYVGLWILAFGAVWPFDPLAVPYLFETLCLAPAILFTLSSMVGRALLKAKSEVFIKSGLLFIYSLATVLIIGIDLALVVIADERHHYLSQFLPADEPARSAITLPFQMVQLDDELRLPVDGFLEAVTATVSAFPTTRMLECHYYLRDSMSPHQYLDAHVCTVATLDYSLPARINAASAGLTAKASYLAPVSIDDGQQWAAIFQVRPKYQASVYYNMLDFHDEILTLLEPEMILTDEPGHLQLFWREASAGALAARFEALTQTAEKYKLGTTQLDVYWQ